METTADGGERNKIMIVDDDAAIRIILGEAMAASGFEVSAAENGFEALRLLEAGARPGVIVTDIVMPDVDGLEVIRKVRSAYPEIRLIAMSGGGRERGGDFLEIARRLGAHAALPKPLRLNELQETVRRLLHETA